MTAPAHEHVAASPTAFKEIAGDPWPGAWHEPRDHMGASAWEVYIWLQKRRGRNGLTKARNRKIAERLGMTIKRVERSMSKLKRMRIVEVVGYRKSKEGRLAIRRVLGEYRNGVVSFPKRIWSAIKAAVGCGTKTKEGRYAWEIDKIERRPDYPKAESSGGGPPLLRRGTPPPIHTENINDNNELSVDGGSAIKVLNKIRDLSLTEIDASSSTDAWFHLSTESHSNIYSKPRTLTRGESSSGSLSSTRRNEASGGTHLEGGVQDARHSTRGESSGGAIDPKWETKIPAFPGSTILEVPRIPRPPVLDDSLSDAELGNRMLRYYWGAHEARFGEKCWILRGAGKLRKSRYFGTLVGAGRELIRRGIPAAAWIGFRMDAWIAYRKRKQLPPERLPLAFVSKGSVEKMAKMWEQHGSSYTVAVEIPSDDAKDLLRAHMELMNHRVRHGDRGIGRILNRLYPGGWQNHYLKAISKHRRKQVDIRRRIERGEYLWR